jgi:hypothetical protein
MSDEQRKDDGERTADGAAQGAPPDDASAQDRSRGGAEAPLPPREALAKGLGLLFQAALGTASAVKESVERGGVHRNISDAGRHIESAASAALRGLEQVVRNVGRAADGAARPEPPKAPPAEPTAPSADEAKPEEPPNPAE